MRVRSVSFVVIFTACLLCVPPSMAQGRSSQQLTETQKKSMLSILAGVKGRVEPLLKQLITLQAEINEQMLADNPDPVAIDGHKSRISGLVGKLVEMRIDDIRQMLGVLTPEQRRLVRAESSKPNGEKDLFNLMVKMFGLPEKQLLNFGAAQSNNGMHPTALSLAFIKVVRYPLGRRSRRAAGDARRYNEASAHDPVP